jgi:hypothetical protein
MRRSDWRLVLAAAPALGGGAIALALRDHPQACRATVLVTGVYTAAMIVLWIHHHTTPVARPQAPYRGERVEPLSQLAGIERSVTLSRSSALEFEHRVQPQLRRTAAERLKLRHGVDLDQDPDAARRLLGESTWHLLTTTHPRSDHTTRPPDVDRILGAIARLEEV